MIVRVEKRHIIVLLSLLVPLWLVGMSNYFFSASSFRVIEAPGPESILGQGREWVGNFDGILMTIALSLSLIGIWIAGLCTGYLEKSINKFVSFIQCKIQFIKQNPKKILLHIGILFAIAIAAFLVELVFFAVVPVLSTAFIVRVLFHMTVGLSAYCIVIFRTRPEALFLSLSFVIGFLYIAAQPPAWFGWDNGIHYAWAVEESFIRTVSVTRADYLLTRIEEGVSFFYYLEYLGIDREFSWFRSQGDAAMYAFTKGTDTLAPVWMRVDFLYTRLAHVPSGIMIFASRSLALPPILTIKLGVLANHLVYSLLVFFAMKRLNSGKYILAVIAMVPTAFVLSTTYGYDHWVIGFLMLGFAYFFNEVQKPEQNISTKNLIIMVGAFFIGLGAKPVYFPLMIMVYFLKRNKFKTKKGFTSYIITVTCLIIIAILSFVVPFLTGDTLGEGDYRGGYGVNAMEQVRFIFENPLTYTQTLLEFLSTHLNGFTDNYFTLFGRLGPAEFIYLIWIVLGFVVITDRNENDNLTSTLKDKVLIALLVFAAASIYSTAMYIAFTEVGESYIMGVQGRYKLPFLFPLFYIIGGFKLQNNIGKTAYSCAVFGIMSFVLLAGAWEKFMPGGSGI